MKTCEQITAVIKARNEGHQIREAVNSALLLADEVFVIDDGSVDETRSTALEAGARVISGRKHGGRIDLLDKQGFLSVQSGWILRMDADERVTLNLARALRDYSKDPRVSGVQYARLNEMFGGFVHWGGWFEEQHLGFFRADAWHRDWACELHSQVPVKGTIKVVPKGQAFMLHFDYSTVKEFVQRTLLEYAWVEARELAELGTTCHLLDITWRPARRFAGRYIVRRGYRDGKRGLVLAAMLASYDVARYAMLWDIQRRSTSFEDSHAW